MKGKRRASFATGAALLLALGAASAPPPDEETFEVALWANDDSVERLPNLVETSDHPCGAIAVMRISRMPHAAEAREEAELSAELVVEIGPSGAEVRRWGAPVDYEPLALRQEELLVRHHDRLLWIGSSGTIRRGDASGALPEIEAVECPAGAPHADSAYRQCGRLRDLESGAPRVLAYEGICT